MHIRLDELPGRLVVDATGALLGKIDAPLVDMETWLVDALRIKTTRRASDEMGLAWSWWKRPRIEVATGLVHAAGDAIILRVSIAELREALPSVTSAEQQGFSLH